MVKNIDNVSIPGFGIYKLYSFQYSPGLSGSSGTIEAEFINSTGVYTAPSMNHAFFPITITSGNEVRNTLGFYTIVAYEISKSGGFKVLKVKFADKSVDLDRYLVALRGQVGYDQQALNGMSLYEKSNIVGALTNSGGRIIWVGESDESCRESVLASVEKQDPCDPCDKGTDNLAVNIINCENYYNLKKRNYEYTLSQLLTALTGSQLGLGFSVVGSPSGYQDHKFEFVGSVREVLNNICSELGLSFFYDGRYNLIKIIDVRSGISVNVRNLKQTAYKDKILEESVRVSREGSKDVFGVSSFQREAEEKTYGCAGNNCRKLKLHPLVLEDLMVKAAHFEEDEVIGNKPNPFERMEFYCVLTGRTSRDFRDMFIWHQEYEFRKATDVEAKIDKKLSALNGMTIKKVFHKGSEASEDSIIYRMLLSIYSSRDFDKTKENAKESNPYFFFAEADEKKDEIVHNLEHSICESFLGQYWMRKYKQHWNGLSYSTISPDGSVSYYDFKNPINLPFADIITNAGGILEDSEIFNRVDGDSFYFMTRPAIFSPQKIDEEVKAKMDKNIEKYLFKEISISPEMEKTLKTLTGMEKDYKLKTHKLYVVPNELESGSSVGLSISETDNEEEAENVIIPINACEKYTSYGLESAESKKFNISFKEARFSITMPVQSFSGQNHDGYIVLIEKTGDDAKIIIPKTEIFSSGFVPQTGSNRLGIEFNSYNASSNDLKYLAGPQDGICSMDATAIQGLLSKLSGLMNYSVGLSDERTYKIEGVPYDHYTVEDGLDSFSISIGSSGLVTSLSFNNTAAFRLSPDAFLKKFKYARFKQLQKGYPTGGAIANDSEDLKEI